MRNLPMIAIVLGVAGLLPVIATSLGALSADRAWTSFSLLALAAYAAVVLSFLGGVHWGFALSDGGQQTIAARRARFGLGVVPSLIGWGGLLLAFLGLPLLALGVLVFGFGAVIVFEARGVRAGMVPRAYMLLRAALSIVVIVCLVSVIIVLLLGGQLTL